MNLHTSESARLPYRSRVAKAARSPGFAHAEAPHAAVVERLRVRRVQGLLDIGLSDWEVARRCDMGLEKVAGLRKYYGL